MIENCNFCYDERNSSVQKLQRVAYFLKRPHVQYEQFLGNFTNNKLAKHMTMVVGTHLAKVEFDCKIGRSVIVESFMEQKLVKLISKKSFSKNDKCIEFRVIEQSNRYLVDNNKKKNIQKESTIKKADGEEFLLKHYKLLFDYSKIKQQKSCKNFSQEQTQEFHIIKLKSKTSADRPEKIELIKQIMETQNNKNSAIRKIGVNKACLRIMNLHQKTHIKIQIQFEEMSNTERLNDPIIEEEKELACEEIQRDDQQVNINEKQDNDQMQVKVQEQIQIQESIEGIKTYSLHIRLNNTLSE